MGWQLGSDTYIEQLKAVRTNVTNGDKEHLVSGFPTTNYISLSHQLFVSTCCIYFNSIHTFIIVRKK